MPQAVASGEPTSSLPSLPYTERAANANQLPAKMPKGDNPHSTPIWGAATTKPIPERALSSVTANSPLPPSVEAAYYRKCIELKRRINEIEESNDAMRLRKVRAERGIMKLRLERAFLLEQIEKKMRDNVDESDESGSPPPTVSDSSATPPPCYSQYLRFEEGYKEAAAGHLRLQQISIAPIRPSKRMSDGSFKLNDAEPFPRQPDPLANRVRVPQLSDFYAPVAAITEDSTSPVTNSSTYSPITTSQASPYFQRTADNPTTIADTILPYCTTGPKSNTHVLQPTDRPLRTKRNEPGTRPSGNRKATPPPSSAPTSQQPTPAHQPAVNHLAPIPAVAPSHNLSTDSSATAQQRPSGTQSFLQTVGAAQQSPYANPPPAPVNGAIQASTLPPPHFQPPDQHQHQGNSDVGDQLSRAAGGVVDHSAASKMANGPGPSAAHPAHVEAEAAAGLAGLRGGPAADADSSGDTEMQDAGFTAVNRSG